MASAKPKKPKEKPAPELSRYQRYELVEIGRADLKNAPFNPRTIHDKARKRLKINLEKIGLTHPLTWNRRTGHLVSGHQRLAVIDSLEGSQNYKLTVAVVDLDEKAEKEQVIFENNAEAQGEWDLDKLEALYKDDKLDFEATGFDTADVYQMFGDSPLIEQPEALMELAEQYRGMHERHKKLVENLDSRDDVNFYAVVVFKSHADRQAFTDALGLDDNRFIDGRFLTAKLGAEGEGPDIA